MNQRDEQLVSLATLGFFSFSLLHNLANQFTQLQFSVEEARKYLPPKQHRQLDLTARYLASVVRDSQQLLVSQPSCEVCFDLRDAVLEALDLSLYDLRQNHILVDQKLVPVRVQGSRVVFLQILLNLLKNSIQALQRSEKRKITLQLKRLKRQGLLILTDSGTGLQDKPHFLTSSKPCGQGLGLAYVQQQMEQHFHGEFSLHNTQNCTGCEVHLTFPLSQLCGIRHGPQSPVE